MLKICTSKILLAIKNGDRRGLAAELRKAENLRPSEIKALADYLDPDKLKKVGRRPKTILQFIKHEVKMSFRLYKACGYSYSQIIEKLCGEFNREERTIKKYLSNGKKNI